MNEYERLALLAAVLLLIALSFYLLQKWGRSNTKTGPARGLQGSVSVDDLLLRILQENKALNENLRRVQGRCSELLLKARDWRKKITELGGEDPGPP